MYPKLQLCNKPIIAHLPASITFDPAIPIQTHSPTESTSKPILAVVNDSQRYTNLHDDNKTFLQMLKLKKPIRLQLLDAGRNTKFIREGFSRSLLDLGLTQTLRTDGVAEATSTHTNSEETELQLKKAFGDTVTLKDSTMKNVTQPAPVFVWDKLLSWNHLVDFPPLRSSGGRIAMLIGLNQTALITSTDYRMGADNELVAITTNLGRTIQGVLGLAFVS
ncbi:LOW QUALITY PROTEIN: hypothetical protein DAPPUDRAFT_253085 [Daphnia pulex]|uniref:Uncharacterized protein n=1 Tax=Daphnia pulex TaxID=6669 RepID=E9H454_DAPPU|nr:LOW QUALITY PROTEIN: hypothetical protein DAPPUDRAFT_253085 [Daphnia pulex]|eukprot:EFX73454.1 LOW QUALITY PROTEIN: hypothetical protein DAPPUDRAFT_253085 [Daphnia pulex]